MTVISEIFLETPLVGNRVVDKYFGRMVVGVDNLRALIPANQFALIKAAPHSRQRSGLRGSGTQYRDGANACGVPPRRRENEDGLRSWSAFDAVTVKAGRGAKRKARRLGEREAVVSKRGREVFRHIPSRRYLTGWFDVPMGS